MFDLLIDYNLIGHDKVFECEYIYKMQLLINT